MNESLVLPILVDINIHDASNIPIYTSSKLKTTNILGIIIKFNNYNPVLHRVWGSGQRLAMGTCGQSNYVNKYSNYPPEV